MPTAQNWDRTSFQTADVRTPPKRASLLFWWLFLLKEFSQKEFVKQSKVMTESCYDPWSHSLQTQVKIKTFLVNWRKFPCKYIQVILKLSLLVCFITEQSMDKAFLFVNYFVVCSIVLFYINQRSLVASGCGPELCWDCRWNVCLFVGFVWHNEQMSKGCQGLFSWKCCYR